MSYHAKHLHPDNYLCARFRQGCASTTNHSIWLHCLSPSWGNTSALGHTTPAFTSLGPISWRMDSNNRNLPSIVDLRKDAWEPSQVRSRGHNLGAMMAMLGLLQVSAAGSRQGVAKSSGLSSRLGGS